MGVNDEAALAGTVGHPGCTRWYVDDQGHDSNQWPWLWSSYRRRTAQIEPGSYALETAGRERELSV